jgi:hypothetical protein
MSKKVIAWLLKSAVLVVIGLLAALVCYALAQLVAQAALKEEADYTV